MNKFVGKVVRLFDGEASTGPTHFFILPTLFYGVGFLFFPNKATVDKSSLHITMVSLGDKWLPMVWGAVLILVFLGTLNTMLTKKFYIAHASSFIGFMAWLFASLMYLQSQNFMLMGAVTIPSMLFWLWLYLRIKAGQTSIHMLR